MEEHYSQENIDTCPSSSYKTISTIGYYDC